MLILINDKDDFQAKLAEAKEEQLVVVDFFATWCGPCRMISPKMEELNELFPEILILKVDVDDNEAIAMEYDVSTMPTFVFMKNKKIITSFTGANYEKLKQTVETNK